MKPIRVYADFNGLFGDILCLSHSDTCKDDSGQTIVLHAGMVVTAFDEDIDEYGKRDDILASGIVERSPIGLRCKGSRWVLKIDSNGVRHESEIENEK
jgi:hypothetical protein